jgi:hypothetical protein
VVSATARSRGTGAERCEHIDGAHEAQTAGCRALETLIVISCSAAQMPDAIVLPA